jgi:fructokinase
MARFPYGERVSSLLGAIELGGTKTVCGVGTNPEDLVQHRFGTSDPSTTLTTAIDFLTEFPDVAAVGIASFGPVELRRPHADYGYITTTPKKEWPQTDVVGPVSSALGVPVGFDTDVDAAALGEGRWGAARGLANYVYVTVGTGIGGGAVVNGQVAHGLVHPEMGHVSVIRRQDDFFEGTCPFHGDCLEGMASGPAVASRWGTRTEEVGADAIDLEAYYLAQGLRNIIYTLAPERIVVGGGLAALAGLLPSLRLELEKTLGGYPALKELKTDEFVSRVGLGDDSGVLGGLVLAEQALDSL